MTVPWYQGSSDAAYPAAMRTLLFLLPMLLWGTAALAQPAEQEPGSAVLQSCLLGTSPDVWTRLKLSPDQMRRMEHIQEACRVECEGAGVTVVENPVSKEDGALIMDEVRMVLSREQYTNWVEYCVASGGGK